MKFVVCLVLSTLFFISCDTLKLNSAGNVIEKDTLSSKFLDYSIVADTTLDDIVYLRDSINSILAGQIDNKTEQEIIGLSKEFFYYALIPFILFLLGVLANWLMRQQALRAETINFRNVVFMWIDSILEAEEEQEKKITELGNNIKKSNDINPERFTYKVILVNKLNDISIEKYISVFVVCSKNIKDDKTNRNDKIYNLMNCLEFLVRVEIAVKEQYEEYRTASIAIMNRCNDTYLRLISLVKEADLYIEQMNSVEKKFHNVLRNSIADYITAVAKENGVDAKIITYEKLVDPVNGQISEIEGKMRTPYIDNVASLISEYMIIKKQWDMNNKGYGDNLLSYSKKIKEACDKIQETKNFFKESTNVKNILKI